MGGVEKISSEGVPGPGSQPSHDVIRDIMQGNKDEEKLRAEGSDGSEKGQGMKRRVSESSLIDPLRYIKEFRSGDGGGQGSSAGEERVEEKKHEQRVAYAQEYGLEVTLDNSSEEVRSAVNKQRVEAGEKGITMKALDRRATELARSKEHDYLYESPLEEEGGSEEGESRSIDDIKMMRPNEMSHEQRVIYAQNYKLEVGSNDPPEKILHDVRQFWMLKHEQRVKYVQEYVEGVNIDESPGEVLDKLNKTRVGNMLKRITLDKLDEKASDFSLYYGKEEQYVSSGDEKARKQAYKLLKEDTFSDRSM